MEGDVQHHGQRRQLRVRTLALHLSRSATSISPPPQEGLSGGDVWRCEWMVVSSSPEDVAGGPSR